VTRLSQIRLQGAVLVKKAVATEVPLHLVSQFKIKIVAIQMFAMQDKAKSNTGLNLAEVRPATVQVIEQPLRAV
jgi:hypothetical protein